MLTKNHNYKKKTIEKKIYISKKLKQQHQRYFVDFFLKCDKFIHDFLCIFCDFNILRNLVNKTSLGNKYIN